MPKFVVYEVQEETATRMWKHTIEASDSDEALQIAKDRGSNEPEDCGLSGGHDYGEQGWAVRESDTTDADDDPWDEAFDNMTENFG